MKDEDSSDLDEDYNNILLKGIRISRPHSEEKINKKRVNEYNLNKYLYHKNK